MDNEPARDEKQDEDTLRKLEAQRRVAEAPTDPRTVSLVILSFLAVMATLYVAREIIIPFVFAAVLNLLLQPAKRFLNGRFRLPAALASLLLILALFLVVAGIATAISLPASTWVARAPEALPMLQEKLGPLQGPIRYVQKGMQQLEHAMQQQAEAPGDSKAGARGDAPGQEKPAQDKPVEGGQPPQAAQQSPSGGGSASLSGIGLSVLSGTGAFLSQFFTVIIILFFLLWAGDTLLRSFVEIMPSFGGKRRVVEIGDEVERNVSGYLATITLMNAIVGVLNGLSTWACGLPDPLLWGTMAFLLNYIPILGPFSGVVIFFVVGVFTYSTIWWAFLPAGIYLLIHVLEGETVTPMLIARRFTLNPVLVILALFFWHWMWGVTGALLAVPMLAIVKIVCDHVPALTPLGHMIGGGRKGAAAAA